MWGNYLKICVLIPSLPERNNSCSASTGANQIREHFAVRSIRRYHYFNYYLGARKPSPATDVPKTWQHLRFILLCQSSD